MSEAPLVYTRRRVRDRVWNWVVDDSVRGFLWVFYLGFLIWGLWGSFWAYPINLISDPMGDTVYDAWVWMPLLAIPTALTGLVLRHGGSPAKEIHGGLLRRDFLGLWMQVGGHACQAITLGVYIGAGIYAADEHQPIISVFVFVPYLACVIILITQCLYKIRLGKQRQ